ncbi:MAG TPA: DUF6498-containing protein [Spirochaetota bacterium]|nr:DUF6498-containing protein [Spirochaetota bacterium]
MKKVILLFITGYGFHELPDGTTPPDYPCGQVAPQNLWMAPGTTCLSHATSFMYNFIIGKEYGRNRDCERVKIPGRRVGAILYTLVPAMILLAALVSLEGLVSQHTMMLLRKGPAALLILFKTYFDYRAHREEHAAINHREE